MVARLDKLPPGARISADQPAPRAAPRVVDRATRSQKAARATGRERWRCGTPDCGHITSNFTDAQRHADTEGHHRVELMLD